jgi:hypothetical protein
LDLSRDLNSFREKQRLETFFNLLLWFSTSGIENNATMKRKIKEQVNLREEKLLIISDAIRESDFNDNIYWNNNSCGDRLLLSLDEISLISLSGISEYPLKILKKEISFFHFFFYPLIYPTIQILEHISNDKKQFHLNKMAIFRLFLYIILFYFFF